MAEATQDNFLSEDLQRAANRVVTEESLKFVAVHQKLKDVIDKGTSLKSQQILGKRELYEVSKRTDKEFDKDDLEEEKTRLREERDQLHKVLIKHKSFSDSLQEAVFHSQLQDAVAEQLTPDKPISPELSSTMQHYNENLQISSELAEVSSVMEESERKYFSLRIKYRTLLQSIENKWKILSRIKSNKGLIPEQRKAPEFLALIEKVNKREDRILFIVIMLQDLISSSGEKWGNNERIVEILLLCDRANTLVSGYEDT